MKTFAERYSPGVDLKKQLQLVTEQRGIKAGVLLSIVGSLTRAELRAAGGDSILKIDGPLEIVSGTGTFGAGGAMHVHLSVADKSGVVVGGHLLHGCEIFTTAEIVIGDLSDEWTFERAVDERTGHLELLVSIVTARSNDSV